MTTSTPSPTSGAESEHIAPDTTELMLPSVALRKARETLMLRDAWMQGSLVSKHGDTGVRVEDPQADCFCSYGALMRALGGSSSDDVMADPYVFFQRATGCMSIVIWNDDPSRTHAEVIDAFRRAEQLAISEGC